MKIAFLPRWRTGRQMWLPPMSEVQIFAFLDRYATLIVLGLLVLLNIAITPNFLSMQTLNVNITQVCTIVIVAVGMTMVIATGGIDLSVGSLIALSAVMLVAGGIQPDRGAAKQRCDDPLASGRAAEIFGRMTSSLGGPADFVDNYERYLPHAPVVRPVHAEGVLVEVDTRAVGNAIIELGGGRHEVGETLDLSVGFTDIAPIGTVLDSNRPLAVVHAATAEDADLAKNNLLAACRFAAEAPDPRPAICRIMTGSD